MSSLIKDRTKEYLATVDSLLNSRSGTDPTAGPRRRTPTPHQQHSAFMQRARAISLDLERVCGQLERLTKLARGPHALFDDHRAAEATELAGMIETGLVRLNEAIGQLASTRGEAPEDHSKSVVVSLQSRLRLVSVSLQQVLRERAQVEQEQRQRREQFSAPIPPLPQNLSLRPNGPAQHPQAARPTYAQAADEHTGLLHGPAAQKGYTAIDMPQTFQQLSLMESQDTSYLESRSTALRGIESSINEIGHIFTQLSRMIAEQGEQVQRIDANIEDVHVNVHRGHQELVKYMQYVMSNRWLMVKIFAVLVVFLVFFNVFLL